MNTTISAELVEANAMIRIYPFNDRGSVPGLVFSKDDLCETIVLWCSTPGNEDGVRIECDPSTTFEVIEKAPTSMTLPELVREFAGIKMIDAAGGVASTRRLDLVVAELRERGALD